MVTVAAAGWARPAAAHEEGPAVEGRPFRGEPVVFVLADAQSGNLEEVTESLVGLHLELGVPIDVAAIPCAAGSTPGDCRDGGTLQERYGVWEAGHPGKVEIVLHGLTHSPEENLGGRSAAEQEAILRQALERASAWGLRRGRPFSYFTTFSSDDEATLPVLDSLGFHTYLKDSGTCRESDSLDVFCPAIPLCEASPDGSPTSGAACRLRAAEDLIAEVHARNHEGEDDHEAHPHGGTFLFYHVRDLAGAGGQIDAVKKDALGAILEAFKHEEAEGHFSLTTVERYHSRTHCSGRRVTIYGTMGGDDIEGTPGDDVVRGYAGTDVIFTYGGNDAICGGAGNDVLSGGDGNDVVRGGHGDDYLFGDEGNDRVRDGLGNNTLDGGNGSDACTLATANRVMDCE